MFKYVALHCFIWFGFLGFQEASNVVDIKSWPLTLDTDDMPKKKPNMIYRAPTPEMIAYLDFSVSTTGMLAGIKVFLNFMVFFLLSSIIKEVVDRMLVELFQISHAAATSLCRSMKLACELYPSRHIALCLDPYCGLGFVLWCLSRSVASKQSIRNLYLMLCVFSEHNFFPQVANSTEVCQTQSSQRSCYSWNFLEFWRFFQDWEKHRKLMVPYFFPVISWL